MSDKRNPNEKVWMEHGLLGPDKRQQVSLKQLQNVWRLAGWVEAEAPPEPELEWDEYEAEPNPPPKKPAKKPAAKKKSAAKKDE